MTSIREWADSAQEQLLEIAHAICADQVPREVAVWAACQMWPWLSSYPDLDLAVTAAVESYSRAMEDDQ